jgi:hypothetical protein
LIALFVGVLIGALPLIAALIANPRLPIPPAAVERSTVASRLGNLFDPVAREFIGVTYAHAQGGLPTPVQIVALAGFMVAYLIAVWRRRRGLLDLVRLRQQRRAPADLLLIVPVIVVVAYATSDSTWYTGTPRYLFVIYPLFAIAVAAIVPRVSAAKVAAGGTVIVVLMALSSGGFFHGLVTEPSTADRDRVLRQVAEHLSAEHEQFVYAGYWTAMPLQYVAGDKLDVAVCVGSKRFAATQTAVASQSVSVYLSTPLDGASDPIGTALRSHHVEFRETQIGFVTIYDHLPENVRPHDLGL